MRFWRYTISSTAAIFVCFIYMYLTKYIYIYLYISVYVYIDMGIYIHTHICTCALTHIHLLSRYFTSTWCCNFGASMARQDMQNGLFPAGNATVPGMPIDGGPRNRPPGWRLIWTCNSVDKMSVRIFDPGKWASIQPLQAEIFLLELKTFVRTQMLDSPEVPADHPLNCTSDKNSILICKGHVYVSGWLSKMKWGKNPRLI